MSVEGGFWLGRWWAHRSSSVVHQGGWLGCGRWLGHVTLSCLSNLQVEVCV